MKYLSVFTYLCVVFLLAESFGPLNDGNQFDNEDAIDASKLIQILSKPRILDRYKPESSQGNSEVQTKYKYIIVNI